MDAVVKKVNVLDVSSGTATTVEQYIVKIGRTMLSRHTDEASAVAAMNEANAARERFRMQVRKA